MKTYAVMLLIIVLASLSTTGLHIPNTMIVDRTRTIYVTLWREVTDLALAMTNHSTAPTTLTEPIKIYRITGNREQFIKDFALVVSRVFDPETLGIWKVRIGKKGTVVRTNYPSQPDQVLGAAFAFAFFFLFLLPLLRKYGRRYGLMQIRSYQQL